MLEEPWALIPAIYAPCYIAGWSATEYWDLTEQLFYDICVFTEKPVLHKKQFINRISFLLTHISSQHNFGTTVVWKQNKKIFISDPHKTIIDGMYNPLSFGGMQHLIDCFKEYIKSPHHDPEKLAAYASRMNSGAVFKRLGYLYSEIIKGESELTDLCRKNLTQGIAALDPSIKSGSITTRWRLKIPKHLTI
jgi:predicted transcriptional regulator of viral defense system